MGIIEEINKFVVKSTVDESLAGMLKESMGELLKGHSPPSNYYYVTHLTNPAETYFSKLAPDIKKSSELAAKLAHGTQLHRFASIWMRKLENFSSEEGLIDGVWEGIGGVRGKIDFKVGDSILELKTKDSLPETPDEIISLYPQDLEQLAFYSVLHPSKPNENYLIFMENSPPYNIKAYKIIIKDFGAVKSILKSRISLLNHAIENKDPSHLGQCRYYGNDCQFHSCSSCSCDKLEPLNIKPLLRSVDISFDEDFTNKLENERDSQDFSELPSLYTTFNIIAPRKHYISLYTEIDSNSYEGESALIEANKAYMWTSLQVLKRKYEIELGASEIQELYDSQIENRLRFGFRWLKLKSSAKKEGEIVPYLYKVSKATTYRFISSPSPYHLAELGMMCAAYGKRNGLIFVLYPYLSNLVKVYQVNYKNEKALLKLIKENIDAIDNGFKEQNLQSLPPCPIYMNDGGNCPLIEKCNKGNGCQ